MLSAACYSSSASVTPSPSPTLTPQETAVFVTSTPIPTSTPRPSPVPTVTPTPLTSVKPITLTIVYDNRSVDTRLGTAWGFACLIETGAETLLFDTGGDGRLLLNNLTTLEINPQAIDAVVLSHSHTDHSGGLSALLAAITPTLYAPSTVVRMLSSSVRDRVQLIDTDQPTTITARLQTTGVMGASILEQALIIKTAQGLSVITGCAHPGIVEIVRQARQWGPIDLIVGGFHLLDASPTQVANVIEELQALGVRRVAPTHCTGEPAIAQFRAAFAANFIEAGAGAVIVLAP